MSYIPKNSYYYVQTVYIGFVDKELWKNFDFVILFFLSL